MSSPTAGGASARFPLEVLDLIFSHFAPDPTSHAQSAKSIRALYRLTLVCRQFYHCANRHMYRCLFVSRRARPAHPQITTRQAYAALLGRSWRGYIMVNYLVAIDFDVLESAAVQAQGKLAQILTKASRLRWVVIRGDEISWENIRPELLRALYSLFDCSRLEHLELCNIRGIHITTLPRLVISCRCLVLRNSDFIWEAGEVPGLPGNRPLAQMTLHLGVSDQGWNFLDEPALRKAFFTKNLRALSWSHYEDTNADLEAVLEEASSTLESIECTISTRLMRRQDPAQSPSFPFLRSLRTFTLTAAFHHGWNDLTSDLLLSIVAQLPTQLPALTNLTIRLDVAAHLKMPAPFYHVLPDPQTTIARLKWVDAELFKLPRLREVRWIAVIPYPHRQLERYTITARSCYFTPRRDPGPPPGTRVGVEGSASSMEFFRRLLFAAMRQLSQSGRLVVEGFEGDLAKNYGVYDRHARIL